ncbi:meiosis regulator and mRNA stability factor 1-like [Uloborus diversus]|uniref:meiosis regulator and mRNA stability factor 1-like n=1 Tax=Uloborus diversus TaxID=327109 RepID=UPI002409DFBB|nr:meiosis regulator and mRNA stability factor 1-like [Uloborus diversus]
MDMEIFLHSIMTDAKGSKSNIAAKFQNALNLHFIPPIGVFWDIENCQVPKGKSAIALVKNIRERFFTNHREAEFMCVCDINKENKTVIQELILSQVTVVHISATSKNAADDKIKQCMRRFVDTHSAPSTLLLISDDVNFASDLSDFRHRHNIHIILLHRGHAHQSLLTCAHEHYEFSSIAGDLPVRSPVKPSDKRPNELIVSELPINKNVGLLKSQLKKISQNCGGKVMHIKGSRATIRFANAEAAERAQRRMDKEIVYGSEISVNFRNKSDADLSDSPPRDVKGSTSSNEASASSCSSRDSSVSPPRGSELKHNYKGFKAKRKFNFPPPPFLDKQNSPALIKHGFSEEFSFDKCAKSESMPMIQKTESTEDKMFQQNWNNGKVLPLSNSKSYDQSAFSPFQKTKDGTTAKYSQRNIGRVSPFLMQDCEKSGRNLMIPLNDSNWRNQLRSDNSANIYPIYSNLSYPSVCSNLSMGYTDLPRMSDNVMYSSQWNGSAYNNDSCQLIQRNQLPCDSSSVELFVTNLDPTFEVNEMKKILLSVFREHIMVLHISMTIQPDGSTKATVKVPSLQDAQYAISRLHRRKIGHKRILISYVTSDKNPPFHVLKSEAVALLNDIPTKSLPLIKFRELYEKRYHRPMTVSDLYKMRDAVTIQGDSGSRIVYLSSEYCKTPSIPESEDSQDSNVVEKQYCERHFHISSSQGWAEQYSVCPLPLVYMSLKTLSTAVHTLLDTHQGCLPLISFCDCYEAEIGPLPVVGNGSYHSTPKTNKGVPLEHLIACVTGVEVAKSVLCIKKVQWLEKKIDSQGKNIMSYQNVSPALAGQLTLFGREVMDLLKSQPHCLIQFNKFIPIYHHHFGRQCRVADYGFTKLIDLLDSIPHIVQVLGEGQSRQVTLTHRTQIKRFAAELLRILKSRASKQITVTEFPQAYEQVIEKPFDITNYGVCEIDDMLDEVPENVIVTCNSGSEIIIGIPKREQTPEEIERTKLFAEEVIELMKHTPSCSMTFSKFIPSYHHHFGKQCRVADYGFIKLIELFEAIPDVLEVKGNGEDKILNLVEVEQHKILTDRLVSVLKAQPNGIIDVNQISSAYAQMHGHALRPADFGFSDLQDLLRKMNSEIRLHVGNYE